MLITGHILTVNTPSQHRSDRAWTQPLPGAFYYRFDLRACHNSYILLSTDSEWKEDYEIILGYDNNEKSVVRDRTGTVSLLCLNFIISYFNTLNVFSKKFLSAEIENFHIVLTEKI